MVTFGCKANQYDTQLLRESLLRRGMTEAEGDSDLVVLNTCAVTEDAGKKAFKLIRRIQRETPKAKMVVTGCLAESEPELLRQMPGVEWVLGNGEAKRPANFLAQLGLDADPEQLGIPSGITEFAGHTRAFVKIQDGCDHACSFCIIPRLRGASRSRSAAELCSEVRTLVEAGHVEVVLCGIHIGHWGRDLGSSLGELLEQLTSLEPRDSDGQVMDYRLRLSSIEATEVDDRILDVMVQKPDRIAPHLHMPLQSGSASVLKRMQRWYEPEQYLSACEHIRERLDRPAFTADVLVGFPGETPAEFEETLALTKTVGFARLHVFPFSPRPQTPAYEMAADPKQRIAPELLRERRVLLAEQARTASLAFCRSLNGAAERIVLEGFAGLSGRYQRVSVDPALLPAGPPPAMVDVTLHVDEGDSSVTLRGSPLLPAPQA